ncbi:MAG: DUF6036 family nucleotidyltransferase [Acidobacteriota bacterium]|nr:DUF6036 family nucleotidyltransferase [Acidobacteriota bacterium]
MKKLAHVNATEIKSYLTELNDELRAMDVKGEICLYGGAVMALVYDARPNTDDVDAIFKPVRYIRRAAGIIAERHDLPKGWLNYGVKMFVVPHEQRVLLDLSHLKVYVPPAEYILAMKALSARVNLRDQKDIKTLIETLGLNEERQVIEIIRHYYPNKEVKPTTQMLLKEIFAQR